MTADELPVPPGFVITSTAFEAVVDADALRGSCGRGPRRRPTVVGRGTAHGADRAASTPSCTGLVAVRSSACAEDSESAPLRRPAGDLPEHRRPRPTVLANVVDCWLSFFTERAVFYRREKGSLDDVAMAVVVQQMVDSQKSGVHVHRRPGRWPQGPHGRRGRPRPGRGGRVRRGHPGQLHAQPRRGGEEEQGRRGRAGPVGRRAAPPWPRWDGSWPSCTEAPRTSSGRSTPTAELFLLQSRPITTI